MDAPDDWIVLSDPDITGQELEAVVMALRSGQLSAGPAVNEALNRRTNEHIAQPMVLLVNSANAEHRGRTEAEYSEFRRVGCLLTLRLKRGRGSNREQRHRVLAEERRITGDAAPAWTECH